MKLLHVYHFSCKFVNLEIFGAFVLFCFALLKKKTQLVKSSAQGKLLKIDSQSDTPQTLKQSVCRSYYL